MSSPSSTVNMDRLQNLRNFTRVSIPFVKQDIRISLVDVFGGMFLLYVPITMGFMGTWAKENPKLASLLFLFPVSITIHAVLGVKTPLQDALNITPQTLMYSV